MSIRFLYFDLGLCFLYILIHKLGIEEKVVKNGEKKKRLVGPIVLEKIGKPSVKVFLLARGISLRLKPVVRQTPHCSWVF
jgi:hypothetical protein